MAGLPPEVERAYKAAQEVKRIDVNAFGVLLGRVLDKVCEDRGATGDSLAKRLQDLAARGEVPEHLVDMAHQLRQLRNVGAHANLGELTAGDVPILDGLIRAVLEYVYSAPAFVRQVEQRIEQRKRAQSAGQPVQSRRDYHINISDANDRYKAEIPDLRGCYAYGNTPVEALEQLELAKQAWMDKARSSGRPIPKPLYRPS